MNLKKLALLLLPVLFITACSTDDALPELSTLSTQTDYIISNQGALPKDFKATVAKNGDTLKRFFPEAGFAVVTTRNPNAYKGVASTVVRDITVQWVDPPIEAVDLKELANPSSSGDNDPLFALQWGHDAVDAPEAWNAGVRGAGVRVAVLDSGIDADHPDLAANVNTELSKSFVEGEDYNIAPGAYFNHGTHVAGTIAAVDNGEGVIGVAPAAEIVAVKVLSEKTGSGTFGGVISGILYAADIDADIINMSLGATLPKNGYTYTDANGNIVKVGANEIAALLTALSRATTYAYQQGTTVIASAGNSARDGDMDGATVSVPGGSTNVLTISATGPEGWALDQTTDLDTPAFYTNYGQSVIDFAAPGGDVDFSLRPGGVANRANWPVCTVEGVTHYCYVFDLVLSTISEGYSWAGGTSMAAPHVSGIAALIISENGGDMKPAQVEQVLRERADDLGKPGNDDYYGAGRVNSGY